MGETRKTKAFFDILTTIYYRRDQANSLQNQSTFLLIIKILTYDLFRTKCSEVPLSLSDRG
jgi:hypothetical protein